MAADQEFCLRWNNFRTNILDAFEASYDGEEFVDVTLSAEGQSVKAHKVLLSACSPYFKNLFKELPPHQHPVIVLRDTKFSELQALLNFIYHGEVHVTQDKLTLLLNVAEALKIKGLANESCYGAFERNHRPKSPPREKEEIIEQRVQNPEVPGLHFGIPNAGCGYNLSTCAPSVRLEPPSHKSPRLPSPPPKRRKLLHSPLARPTGPCQITPGHTPPGHTPSGHTPPGHTPPGHTPPSSGSGPSCSRDPSVLQLLQGTPPQPSQLQQQMTPTSSAASINSEDDAKVVNLSLNNNGHNNISRHGVPSPTRVIPKIEVGDDDDGGATLSSGGGGEEDRDSEHEREEVHPVPDEDSKDDGDINSSSQDMPPLSHIPVTSYGAYGQSQHDPYPGPSGVLASASQTVWRGGGGGGGGPIPEPCDPGQVETCKKYVCPLCNWTLDSVWALKDHLARRHDMKVHKCVFCGAKFREVEQMALHMGKRHGEKLQAGPNFELGFS